MLIDDDDHQSGNNKGGSEGFSLEVLGFPTVLSDDGDDRSVLIMEEVKKHTYLQRGLVQLAIQACSCSIGINGRVHEGFDDNDI